MKRSHLNYILLLSLLCLFSGFSPANADIYRYVDADGVIHFTNTPTHGYYNFYRKEVFVDRPDSSVSYSDLIIRYAGQFNLDEALIKAVIKVESNYQPHVVSNKGAQGLMQLIPDTARDLNVIDPFDPSENIRGGTWYLRQMLDTFNGDLDLALAAYNAGPNAVKRYGGIPPYTETIEYIQRVKHYFDYYRQSGDTLL
ncbi:MAG: lytic transglycosylase domain-containing protein [Deltaproteobacteria bacterium]|jgi:soluble lytic murein transglycosylase|nr:lytic transglycosylase domain-containing protein [Deltaproteobacteria bacterium]MBW2475971.1 lytic transglycosylase domain-containing protein [Deltaproteobacteria bacterium]